MMGWNQKVMGVLFDSLLFGLSCGATNMYEHGSGSPDLPRTRLTRLTRGPVLVRSAGIPCCQVSILPPCVRAQVLQTGLTPAIHRGSSSRPAALLTTQVPVQTIVEFDLLFR